jgi:heme-degrading monooxygenase HmoA
MVVARLTFAKLKPGTSTDKMRKIFDESVLPAAMTQKGFCGSFALSLGEEGIVVSLWESKTDAEASVKSGFHQEQAKKFAPMFAAPPESKLYDVTSKITLVKE